MSYTAEQLVSLATQYQEMAANSLEAMAKKKEESDRKLDPKAKVRNRGDVVFPAEKSKDHKDRYPINNIDEARAALRYAGKQKSAPWYHGTVEEMKKAVERAVHRKFPSLKPEAKSKKSYVEIDNTTFNKYV